MSTLPPPPGDPSLPPPPPQVWFTPPAATDYAGFWRRVAARLIDGIILLLPFITTFVSVLSDVDARTGLTTAQLERLESVSLGILIVGAVYEILMIAWRGQTLGKMAVGIRVVHADGRGSVGLGWSAVRWAIPAAAGRIPIVGSLVSLLIFLWMLWDPMKQGLHDKAARTVVVRVRP